MINYTITIYTLKGKISTRRLDGKNMQSSMWRIGMGDIAGPPVQLKGGAGWWSINSEASTLQLLTEFAGTVEPTVDLLHRVTLGVGRCCLSGFARIGGHHNLSRGGSTTGCQCGGGKVEFHHRVLPRAPCFGVILG